MKRILLVLAGVVFLASASPAPAQLIFSKKPKVNPSQRVPELIVTVKTDQDEKKRTQAAEELRDYDSVTFSEIVPVLVDVLKNDKSASVRIEAVHSLSKIRPVTTRAGQALEKAAADDESWRVRLQAKSVLPKYHLAGFVGTKKADTPTGKTTGEPPLNDAPLPLPRFDPLSQPRITPTPVTPPRPPPKTVTPSKEPVQGPSLFP
jgi:hypothetical protein